MICSASGIGPPGNNLADPCVCNASLGAVYINTTNRNVYIRTRFSVPCNSADWEYVCNILTSNCFQVVLSENVSFDPTAIPNTCTPLTATNVRDALIQLACSISTPVNLNYQLPWTFENQLSATLVANLSVNDHALRTGPVTIGTTTPYLPEVNLKINGSFAVGNLALHIHNSSPNSTILGGVNNTVFQTLYSTVFGGDGNTISGGNRNNVGGDNNILTNAIRSSILSGQNNAIDRSTATANSNFNNAIVTGDVNIIRLVSQRSFIGAGFTNTIEAGLQSAILTGNTTSIINSTRAAIVTGFTNVINASTNAVIIGGQNHQVLNTSTSSIIGGGNNNIIRNATNSAILAGLTNTIGTSTTSGISSSVIVTGNQNTVETAANGAFIGTGNQNTIFGVRGAIVTGNSCTSQSDYGIIGAGTANQIFGLRSAILTGNNNSVVGTDAAIVSGQNNSATGARAGILAGINHSNSGTNSAIGGGDTNNVGGTNSGIGAGNLNLVNGLRSFIIAGQSHNIIGTATNAVIGGGSQNTLFGTQGNSGIFTGFQNNITGADQTFIGSGSQNQISAGPNNAIVTGANNQITSGNDNAIGAGANHLIFATSVRNFIAGGSGTTIATSSQDSGVFGGLSNLMYGGLRAAIIAGSGNRIGTVPPSATNTLNSVIVGGQFNVIANGADNNVIAGGNTNTITGDNSFIGGGAQNTVNSLNSAVIFGQENAADGLRSMAGGYLNAATAEAAIALGRRARVGSIHVGAFLWQCSHTADFNSAASNEFALKAHGGYRFFTNAAATTGMTMAAGGSSWLTVSSKRVKDDFQEIDTDILAKLKEIKVERYRYKKDEKSDELYDEYNIGTTAEEWATSFGDLVTPRFITKIEEDEEGNLVEIQLPAISEQDQIGVLLLAVQQLSKEIETLKKGNK